MAQLLDSNMMLRWANKGDPDRPMAISAMQKTRRRGEVLRSTPQNYTEFWSGATRPATVNGLGLTPAQTAILAAQLRASFPLLPDTGLVFEEWLRVVTQASVSGRQVHDARLVAVMLAHGLTHILTFNVKDFQRYHIFGITAVHPADV